MNPSSRRMLLGALGVLALAIGGLLAWRHGRGSVGKEDVAAFLDKAAGGGLVRFTAVTIDSERQVDSGLQLSVSAEAFPAQPLYSRVEAAGYLAQTFQLDPDSTAEARRLLADRAA